MDQEVQNNLREIKQIVTENNQLLKKLVFHGKLNLWIRISYWAILILIAVGAIAVIKPVLKSLGAVYAPGGFSETLKVLDAPSAFEELKTQLSE